MPSLILTAEAALSSHSIQGATAQRLAPEAIVPQGCSLLKKVACAGTIAACIAATSGAGLAACVAAAAPSCLDCL